jgi:hypothetical protein
MKKATRTPAQNGMRREYDLSKLKGGVRGKYFKRYQAGTNLVRLAPDVAKVFPSDDSVNTALRALMAVAKSQAKRAA